jgi:hypothetical protein
MAEAGARAINRNVASIIFALNIDFAPFVGIAQSPAAAKWSGWSNDNDLLGGYSTLAAPYRLIVNW